MIESHNEYIECVNNNTRPSNYYYDKDTKEYKLCYESCLTCEYGGDGNENNCTSCDANYILKPDVIDTTNCVPKCKYFYYYTTIDQYKCTICPDEYNLFVNKKNKCINDCENDDIYKYQYSGECLDKCPIDTKSEEGKYICKDIDINRCLISENKLRLLDENFTKVEKIAKNYAKEFYYTDNHISVIKNNIYTITLYKNKDCIPKLNLETPEIDLDKCLEKIKSYYNIEENLIIIVITKKEDDNDYPKMIYYSINDPSSGEKLIYDDICANESLIVQENLEIKINNSNLDINMEYIKYLAKQNIDVFDLTSAFYTDICFEFDSPLPGSKDIPLKDRIKLFFPNITLCENHCEIKGINLTTLKSICECKLNKLLNSDFFGNNFFLKNELGEIQNLLNAINIEVLKCYRSIFIYKYFISCYGGFLVMGLILIQIILTIIYYSKSFYIIRKYIFNISDIFISYLSDQCNSNNNIPNILSNSNDINSPRIKEPPKKKAIIEDRKEKRGKTQIIRKKKRKSSRKDINDNIINNNYQLSEDMSPSDNKLYIINSNSNSKYLSSKFINSNFSNDNNQYKLSDPKNMNYKSIFLINIKNDLNVNIEEYLSTEPENMDYDDAIKKDKRKMCEIFVDNLKSEQISINTFYTNDPLKPRSIKLLLFILDIDLYFFINGLFFTEDFIIDLLKKKNNFFSLIERLSERLLYIALVGIIINYIIDFFFIEEKKIKGIFRREKNNLVILKFEINRIIKIINNRFNMFIILSYVITLFTLFYILCFNIVYPSMKEEWIKTSFIIIITMEVLSLLECFLESLIRFISFKCKSEKIYKISYLLA